MTDHIDRPARLRVYGLDLSLTSTGVACVLDPVHDDAGPPRVWAETIKPRHRGHERLDELAGRIHTFIATARPGEPGIDMTRPVPSYTFVVVEGPIYRVPKVKMGDGTRETSLRGYHERAGLWWMITHRLWRLGIPVAVAPPSSIKLFATGKGNAAKDRVFASVVRKFPDVESNDEADALACAAMGAAHLGVPLVQYDTTLARERALAGVEWWPALESVLTATGMLP